MEFSCLGSDLAGLDLGGLVGQSVFVRPGRHLYRHIDDLGLGQPRPRDGIDFRDNGNDIVNCNFQPLLATATPGTYTATCDEPTNSLQIGDHAIDAIFFGDSTYFPNTGSLPTQTVDQADTTTTITSPTPGTSITYGNESQLSFNVTVTGVPGGANQSPSGQVNMYDGTPGPDTYMCTAFVNGGNGNPSNGNCYINDTTLNAGPYMIIAVYGGDNNYNGSSSAPQDLTIDQVTTQMQVFPVPGYALYGAESGNFFIVGVGGNTNNGNATGSVSVTANGVNLVAPGSCSAGNGGGNPCFIDSATALPASTTPYTVTASYPGDANFLPDSTTVPLSVFPATSSVVLSISPASTSYGDESAVDNLGRRYIGNKRFTDRIRRGAKRRRYGVHDYPPSCDCEHGIGILSRAGRHPASSRPLCADRELRG